MCMHIPSLAEYNCLQLQWDHVHAHSFSRCIQLYPATALLSVYTSVSSCNGINCIQLQWDYVHAHSFARCIQLSPAAVGSCACTFLLSLYTTVSSYSPSLAVYTCLQLQWDHVHRHSFSCCIQLYPAAMGSCASAFLLSLYTTVSSCSGIMCIDIPSLAVFNCIQLQWDHS